MWRRRRRWGQSSETLLNLIGIHPGRGAEEPCRKATVIYEQREQPRCSKMDESHSVYSTDIKGEFHPQIHSHCTSSACDTQCIFMMKCRNLVCHCAHCHPLACNFYQNAFH